jgi:predicted transcriptional regulator
MDLIARKYKLIEHFMKLTSLKKIKRLEEVLQAELNDEQEIVAHTAAGESLNKEQYIKRVKDTDAAIDRGEYLTHDELKSEVRSWKK